MIEGILPAAVASAEAFGDPECLPLFPAEAAVVSAAVDTRRREFTTARWCARRALASLGVRPAPILPTQGGAPRWPADVVGSITHCVGYRAAAVAHASDIRSIGIDAEPNEPLPEGVHDLIAFDVELHETHRLCRHRTDVHWDRLLFCAKESVYKAWFPLVGGVLGFDDVCVALGTDGTFSARIPADASSLPWAFTGRWRLGHGLLMTAVVVVAHGQG